MARKTVLPNHTVRQQPGHHPNCLDVTGQRFGRLVALERTNKRYRGSVVWRCACDCGQEKHAPLLYLKLGSVSSCGCKNHDGLHGHCKRGNNTKTYRSWRAMIDRCEINAGYIRNGITVCERWRDFRNFLADMGERPFTGATVDRIDNSLGYSPDNCRWASRRQQSRNMTTNRILTFRGRSMCVADWADFLGISQDLIYSRLGYKWTVEQALTIPRGRSRFYRHEQLTLPDG